MPLPTYRDWLANMDMDPTLEELLERYRDVDDAITRCRRNGQPVRLDWVVEVLGADVCAAHYHARTL